MTLGKSPNFSHLYGKITTICLQRGLARCPQGNCLSWVCLGRKGLGDIRGSGLKQGFPRRPDEVVPPSVWHTGGASEKWKISIKRQIRAAWRWQFSWKLCRR